MRFIRGSEKEFPFLLAFVVALLLHAVIGVVLKNNPLVIASPVMAPAVKPPVTMRFIEVPPETKAVPKPPPETRIFSDKNRMAGPLSSTRKAQPEAQPAQRGEYRRPSPSPGDAPSRPARSSEPSLRPENDIVAPPAKDLSKSLANLDRYLQGGAGEGGTSVEGGSRSAGTIPPGSGVYFDTRGHDLGPWANRVIALVKSNWIVPLAVDLGYKGISGISFEVDRTGKILNLKVVSPSGVPSYDKAALNALQASSPLPPLPADFPRPILPGVFRFYYNIPIAE